MNDEFEDKILSVKDDLEKVRIRIKELQLSASLNANSYLIQSKLKLGEVDMLINDSLKAQKDLTLWPEKIQLNCGAGINYIREDIAKNREEKIINGRDAGLEELK